MSLTSKQREYLMQCNKRWNVKTGATGSGKSYVDIAVTIPKRLFAAKGEGLLVLLGNTRGTLERNILDPMRVLYPGHVSNIRSDNTVSIFGKKAYVLGADNKKHVARIQGATFEYVYGDEVTTWNEDVFQMLKSRLRCEHSHFDGTCNPGSPDHWFKSFLESGADVYCQNYVIDDGVLPKKVVEQLKREYAGTVYYDRYILGLWKRAEGLVYPMFDEKAHLTAQRGGAGAYYISVDYGTVNPTAMGLWRLHDGGAVMEREYYHDSRAARRQKTDEEYYSDLETFAGDTPITRVIIDPSAASFKECIRRHGRFKLLDADNSVLDGIRLTAALLAAGKIKIHESCANTIKEFGAYMWDGKLKQDAVIKENDHAMDQMRYFCQTLRHKFKEKNYKPLWM